MNYHEESNLKEVRAEQTIDNLHSKKADLETILETTEINLTNKLTNISVIKNETKIKEEVIQSFNNGFNEKIVKLKGKWKAWKH